MISESSDQRRGSRLLLGALLASLAIHALLAALSSWLPFLRLPFFSVKPVQRETVVASTAVRIERRAVPQPRTHAVPRRTAAIHPPVRPPAPRAARPQPLARPRHEIARTVPSAAPQPSAAPEPPKPASSLAEQLAQQQRAFAQEIARLRAQNNPLSIAAKPRASPAAFHRTYFDVSGRPDERAVQVELFPIRHWYSASAICYYARYVAQFVHGGNEEGIIPWPICYPAGADRIANPPYVHDVPIPVPPAGYVLPPGTYLTPLLARIYAARAR
ncbi:MAG TPA: hypothetical protein VJP76_08365 [Candidatus Tumulicola sp.]|nr:hypothetical protein [Candidatus Tumulicola sp.]